jgi:hypothetical protein
VRCLSEHCHCVDRTGIERGECCFGPVVQPASYGLNDDFYTLACPVNPLNPFRECGGMGYCSSLFVSTPMCYCFCDQASASSNCIECELPDWVLLRRPVRVTLTGYSRAYRRTHPCACASLPLLTGQRAGASAGDVPIPEEAQCDTTAPAPSRACEQAGLPVLTITGARPWTGVLEDSVHNAVSPDAKSGFSFTTPSLGS